MERLKHIKEALMGCIESQMSHLEAVDTKELGEAIDMIKDLEEAMYYCTITKAMHEKGYSEESSKYYRDMDKENGRLYYTQPSGRTMGGFSGNTNWAHERAEWEYPMERDSREGRSPMSRKTYMESKEMHQPKTTQMKELEKYLQELSVDITEMIQDASPEEKSFLEKKITTLAQKINQPQ